MAGSIVVLNGAPRAGKTSIAAAIQETFDGVWMHFGVDAVKERMTPERYQPGIGLRPGEPDHPVAPLVPLFYGALYDAIAAFARAGLDVVADTGHHDPAILTDCARRVAELPAYFVGVRCPLEIVLERRRATWGARAAPEPGEEVPPPILAWQEQVHAHAGYDLEVDTSLLSPEQCADAIRRRLDEPPTAFARLAQ